MNSKHPAPRGAPLRALSLIFTAYLKLLHNFELSPCHHHSASEVHLLLFTETLTALCDRLKGSIRAFQQPGSSTIISSLASVARKAKGNLAPHSKHTKSRQLCGNGVDNIASSIQAKEALRSSFLRKSG